MIVRKYLINRIFVLKLFYEGVLFIDYKVVILIKKCYICIIIMKLS